MDKKQFFQDIFLPFSFSTDYEVYSVELDKVLKEIQPTAIELKMFISMVQLSPVLTFLLDKNKKILYMNNSAKHQLKNTDEFLGQTITELSVANLHAADVKKIWHQTITNGFWSGTIDYLDQNENKRTQWIKLIQLKTDSEPLYALFFLDTTSLNNFSNSHNTFAYIDRVTNLPNFNQIAYNLNKQIAEKREDPCGIALFRCSNIAKISALYSRKTRRLVTLETVRRINSLLPENYQCYRLSREIFAVLATELSDIDDFKAQIEKIRSCILQPIHIDKHVILPNYEVGATHFPEETTDLESLLEDAEICLEQHNSNQVVYYTQCMTKEFINSLRTVERLKSAIANNELDIHYQPIFNHDHHIVAAEALLRWNDSELGYVPPNLITKYAEEHSCVSELANWILEKVFRDNLYKSITVTINLDVAQAEQTDFLPTLEILVTKYHVNPQNIIFEITEHQAFEQSKLAINILHELKRRGFRIALDDFGVGHSALSLLGELPADIIKIDASFITNVEENSKKGIIARHIVDLAKSLHLRTCCEGIETENEAQLARLIQANYMQGYLFSKALPLSEFHQFSEEWQRTH